MRSYFIKDLESITGIKAHTIRIWEQRYHLIRPKRTGTNIRYYDDEDVKLLMNIAQLNKNGLKISKIANLSQEQIQNEALVTCRQCCEYDDIIDGLILATYNLNEATFNAIFNRFIKEHGFDQAMLSIGFPLLARIGDLWVSGSIEPAFEHFASNLIRAKLQYNIEQIEVKRKSAQRFLLLLAPGEMHELSLLYANYIIRLNGHNVLYLGQSTPMEKIEQVLENFKADYLVSFFTHCKSDIDAAKFVNDLHKVNPRLKMILSGCSLLSNRQKITEKFNYASQVNILEEPRDLTHFLKENL